MPIIAKAGTVWNGPTDFVGKKVGSSATVYAICSKIHEAGYDVNKDVQWVPFDNDADKIAAVLNGELDYLTRDGNADKSSGSWTSRNRR